jgi:EmrB/QacA subfamily drug resistance transporter
MTANVAPSKRPYVIASIMLATFMVSIEATIVATAMPHIIGELGGFAYYSWVFSAFLLAQSTTTVIYGKLSDTLGRKPTLIGGVILFLIGSLLCGFAHTMVTLVLFRLVQGLGAGAITPITITLIGDLYSLEQRGRVQGATASVWAISGVLGPLAGGIIVDHLPWAWIFWINLPVGILTIVGFAFFLHETVERRRVRIDYLGATLFSISIVSLLLILTETEAGWLVLGSLTALFLVSGWLFFWQERRAPEPIISMELWGRKLIATSNAATLLIGIGMIGLTTVMPIYVQGVLGRSPVVAGLTLSMLVVGWPLAVTIASRLFKYFELRRILLVGSLLYPVGAALLLFMNAQSSPVLAGVGSFLMGCGMGVVTITTIALVQDSVEWSMRGSATASIIFTRSLGNTLGATTLGALLNLGIVHYGSGQLASSVHGLLNQPSGLAQLASTPAVRDVFDHALHWSFIGVVVVSVLAFIITWMIPIKNRSSGGMSAGISVSEGISH